MLAALPAMGLRRIAPPDGAFYVYADVGRWTGRFGRLSRTRILREAGVAVTPGVDFDPDEGQHWLRFSYAGATPDIREGLRAARHGSSPTAGARPLDAGADPCWSA